MCKLQVDKGRAEHLSQGGSFFTTYVPVDILVHPERKNTGVKQHTSNADTAAPFCSSATKK